MAKNKADPKAMSADFVVNGLTQAQIARKYGLTAASISERARREDWKGQKLAYENSVTRRSFEKVAEAVAVDKATITSEVVAVSRATLRAYAQQLRDGNVHVTPKDAEAHARFLMTTLGTGGSDHDDSRTIIDANPDASEFIRRVVEDARGRLDPARVLEAGVLERAPRDRPN